MPRPLRKNLFVASVILYVWCALPHAGAWAQERGLGVPAQAANGRYFALVIGNNAYQFVQRLQTAETDAREVSAILRDRYGFQTKLLLNANRQQIISAINSYRRELTTEANLLIYYAGHGINDKEIEKAYWLPVDARLDDNSNWISADDITSNIKGIPAKHILIVSDSCYSGTLTRGLEANFPAPSERQRYLQKMFAGKSRTLMASGGNEPVADGGGGNHSVFANALLRGLAQMDKSEFTAGELFRDFVEESVAGRVQQTPEYNPLRNSGHESGDFVFVRHGATLKMVEAATASAPLGPAAQRPPDPSALELAFWDSIKNSSDPQDFKAYLDKFPEGTFADLARRRAGTTTLKAPGGKTPTGKTPMGDAAEGNVSESSASGRGEKRAVKLSNVRDYFLQLPEQYLRLPPARRAEVLRSESTIVDIKNGYISFQLGAHSHYALTVFKLDADSYLVAVSYFGPPTALLHTSALSFLRYEGEQWRDVTKATLPVPFDPTLKYELPRYGTTIAVTNPEGGKVFDLVWANGAFVVKRPPRK